MTERLVFASRRIPYPLTNGSRVRTNRLLQGLSRAFETAFVVYEHPPESGDGGCSAREIAELFPGVEIVPVPFPIRRKRGGQLRSVLSAHSWAFGRYRTPAFEEALRATVARWRPDVVHFDDPGVGLSGPVPGTLTVLGTHNVEHRIVRGTAEADRGARRAFAAMDWRKLMREEERLWRRMPMCLAVSAIDAETMRRAGARRVEICPNGTDPVAPLEPPRRRADEPLRMLFLGSASYDPYERGLAWLIREVLPRVRASLPVTFDVVGVPPRRPVSAPGVTYRGRVSAVTPWYEAAHAVVVPVFTGSGTRLKVIEAMAHRRPVVSTHLGVEGLPVEAGVHYLEADDSAAFASELVALGRGLSESQPEVDRMLDAARDAVAPLTWPRIADELTRLYRRELARTQVAA